MKDATIRRLGDPGMTSPRVHPPPLEDVEVEIDLSEDAAAAVGKDEREEKQEEEEQKEQDAESEGGLIPLNQES